MGRGINLKVSSKSCSPVIARHILNIHHITIPFQLSWDQFNGIPIFVRQLLKERFCCCLFLRVSCFIFSNRCHGRAIQCNRDSARERCHQFQKKGKLGFQVWMLLITERWYVFPINSVQNLIWIWPLDRKIMNIQILRRLKPETFLIFDQNDEKIRINPHKKQWRKTKSKNNNLLLREKPT